MKRYLIGLLTGIFAALIGAMQLCPNMGKKIDDEYAGTLSDMGQYVLAAGTKVIEEEEELVDEDEVLDEDDEIIYEDDTTPDGLTGMPLPSVPAIGESEHAADVMGEYPSDAMGTSMPKDSVTNEDRQNDGVSSRQTSATASPLPSAVSDTTDNTGTKSQITISLKNKKTYALSYRVIVKAGRGIKRVRINKRLFSGKGKKKLAFSLSAYRKYIRKKNKWNHITVTDRKGQNQKVRFKVK